MSKIVVEAKGIEKTYKMSKRNVIHALRGANITVEESDFVAIIGPSGCGKSTLMHILGLLDRPDGGTLEIDGIDMTRLPERKAYKMRAKKIGFIFQGFNLIPTLTALENVVLAGRYGGFKKRARFDRAKELLKMLGLEGRMNHKPNELSGGQQQRVAIARALMNDPAIILADEPTGELDTKTSLEIMEILKDLNVKKKKTFVIVTHNTDVAKTCKKIMKIKDGKNE